MESEIEPALQMEETPEARIVIVHLPGFKKENLKVQIDNRGNLIISGERGGKEMEEMAQVGGRLEETHRFRKVIAVPDNLNIDARIIAKFRDQTLRVSLPLLHISDQEKQDAIPASGKPADQSAETKDERPSVARQEDSMHERSGVAEDDKRAGHPEATRHDIDDKAKGIDAAEESKGMVEDRKTEAPKMIQDFLDGEPPLSKDAQAVFDGEPPLSKDAQAVSTEAGGENQSQIIQSKSKQQEEEAAADHESSLPSANDEFREKIIQIPSSTRRSLFFTRCCIVL